MPKPMQPRMAHFVMSCGPNSKTDHKFMTTTGEMVAIDQIFEQGLALKTVTIGQGL